MAKFEITFRPSVARDTKSIPTHHLKRIIDRINLLADDPRPLGSTKLSGKDYYRIRQGDYKIVYEAIESRVVIVVIKIGHRREVYR